MRRLPTSRDYMRISEKVKEYVGDERILLFGIDAGGKKVLDGLGLREALHNVGVKSDYGFLRQADGPVRKGKERGYRPIEGLVLDPDLKYSKVSPISLISHRDAKFVALVDDDVHTGESLSGAVLYLLQNRENVGYEKLFSIVDIDALNSVANFARERSNLSGISTIHELMSDVLLPSEYQELEKFGYPAVIEDNVFDTDSIIKNAFDLIKSGVKDAENYLNDRIYEIKSYINQKPTRKKIGKAVKELKRLENIATML